MARLTARTAQTIGDGLHADGGDLYLQVRGASRAWVFRYKRAGKVTVLGLGSTAARPLAEARKLAYELRNALANGEDPRARLARLTGRAEAVPTFERAALRLIETKRAGWRNAKHAQQWIATLRAYVFPRLGRRKPDSIALGDVLEVLSPIWATKTETATRVRQRIEAVLDYCTVQGWRSGENPARWKGMLDKVLAPPQRLRRTRHFAAADYRHIPALMQALAQRRGAAALCLRFIVLTGCRSGEARGATWGEVDMDAGVWTIPAERMKARRAHRVPLSDEAVAVLREAHALRLAGCDLVFPGPYSGRPLTDVAVSKALRAVHAGATVHGMRAAFKTWAEDSGRYRSKTIEAALAHVNGDKVEEAYMRSDLFEQRRALMHDWARHCCPGDAKIIALPSADGALARRSKQA